MEPLREGGGTKSEWVRPTLFFATDDGTPPLTATSTLNISITNVVTED